MTTRRLVILLAVVAGTCAAVFLLPRQLASQPVGISLQLPEFLGRWWGQEGAITQKERDTLGADTEFARRLYQSGSGDFIHTSIVLSGQDMMTGIHRPERCLFAQGWTVGDSSLRTIDVPGFGKLQATRLHTQRRDLRPGATEGGKEGVIRSLTYYWFVGCNEVAATHYERVWIDSRDRIMRGYNQRWAMVLLTAEITDEHQRFGRSEKETDALVSEFVKQLAPAILRPELKHDLVAAAP